MGAWSWRGAFRRLLEIPARSMAVPDELAPQGRARLRYCDSAKELQLSHDMLPYKTIASGATFAPVATIAALEAVDDSSLSDGAIIFVQSVRDIFVLTTASTEAVDGITVASTLSGTGRWLRQGLGSREWAEQGSWYIDPAGGDDENPGTAAAPLASYAELRRRWHGQTITQIVTVHILGDVGDIVCDFLTEDVPKGVGQGAVLFVGTRSQEATAVLSGVTPHVNEPSGSRAIGTLDFAVDVSAQLGRMIVVEDGPAAGAVAWAVAHPSSGDVTQLSTGPFLNAVNDEVFPSAGDTVGFYSLTQVASVEARPTAFVGLFDVHVTGNATFWAGVENSPSLGRSRWDGQVRCMGRMPITGSVAGDDRASFACQFSGSWFRDEVFVLGGGLLLTQCCVMSGSGGLFVKYGGQHGLSLTLTMIGNGAEEPVYACEGFTANTTSGTICFSNYRAAADCIRVTSGGRIIGNDGGSGRYWGRDIAAAGAGNVVTVAVGSLLSYPAADPPDFSPNADVLVAGTSSTTAGLPLAPVGTLAGIVEDA